MGEYRRKYVSEKSIGRCKRSSTALRQSLENKVRKAALYSDLLTTHPWAQMVQFSHATVPLMIGKTLPIYIYIYTGVVGGEKRKEKETPGPACGNTFYSFLLHIHYTVHMQAKNNVCFICILLLEIMYSILYIIQYRQANYS